MQPRVSSKRFAADINFRNNHEERECIMRKLVMALGLVAVAAPTALVLPASSADAQHYRHHRPHHNYKYREWRGRDGRMYCRKTDGTTGTIVGGVAGALLGRSVDTHGDRTTGTVLGAAGGALVGHSLDSHRKCR